MNEIENALDYLEDKHPVIVCGDFNCRIDHSNQRGVDLLAFFSANDFECLNDPTKGTYVAHNGWSTIDLIFTRNTAQSFTEVVPTHITKHHMVTAFLDLNPTHNPLKQPSIRKVAFDRVDRILLLEKRIRYGLQGKTLQMVRAICETNFQYIVDGGHRSREIPQSRGVAQGDKLSPLLFSLYIADMHYYLQDHNVNIIFYADDLVIGSNNLEAVQNCLNDIAEYCHRNALRIKVR